MTASIAACAPSTFDNITGGDSNGVLGRPHEAAFNPTDKSLDGKEPRPVGPFSAAWVNTSKPHFKWALQQGTTGATLELCKSREFKDGVKRVVVAGSDHVVTEDLAPGVWFWRLQARNESGQGTTYSPVWEVLVRGPSQRGSSDTPRGGFHDGDGDGVADIIVSAIGNSQVDDKGTLKQFPDLLLLFATESSPGIVTYDPTDIDYQQVGEEAPSVAAGFDADGDGYGDFAVATIWPPYPPSLPNAESQIFTYFGGVEGYNDDKDEDDYDTDARPFTTIPALTSGDFNGDGYGDVSAIFPDSGTAFLGGKRGLASMLQFATAPKLPAAPTTFSISSTDLDGDGIYDLAFAPFDTTTPLALVRGESSRFAYPTTLAAGGSFTLPSRPIAMVSGDFDGDAIEEIAFTTTLADGKGAVCVYTHLKPTLNAHGCWVGDAAAAGFGTTIKAADLDADGRDELLVSTGTGIVALSHAGNSYDGDDSIFKATPITGAYAPRFSVVHPGRPGKARWVVMGTDTKSIYIHEGIGEGSLKQTIDFTKMNKQDYDFVRTGTTIR